VPGLSTYWRAADNLRPFTHFVSWTSSVSTRVCPEDLHLEMPQSSMGERRGPVDLRLDYLGLSAYARLGSSGERIMPEVNWLAVVAAALSMFVLSAVWYSPLLFAKP
jgi:hypothetical protein